METYRFNIYELGHGIKTRDLQSKDKDYLKWYLEEDFLDNYTLRYNIPKREVTKRVAFCDALFNRVGPKKEYTKEVKWYETIYNVKVEKINHAKPYWHNLKVSFSVKCTPKEAWIIGEALKSMYGKVTYKRKGN